MPGEMVLVLLLGGAFAFACGMAWLMDSRTAGGALKTILPAIGLTAMIAGFIGWANIPPEPKKTEKQIVFEKIQDAYDQCYRNLNDTDALRETKLTAQELCARSTKSIRAMYEGFEIPKAPSAPVVSTEAK